MADGVKIAELPGRSGFPVAICRTGKVEDLVEPCMFYVWIFSGIAEDYIPIACYNTKEEADEYLALYSKEYKEKFGVTWTISGAVIQRRWAEFMEMAVATRLKELAEPLKQIAERMKEEQK